MGALTGLVRRPYARKRRLCSEDALPGSDAGPALHEPATDAPVRLDRRGHGVNSWPVDEVRDPRCSDRRCNGDGDICDGADCHPAVIPRLFVRNAVA